MKKIAVFDIDGVLADYEGKLHQILLREFGFHARCDRSLYRLEDRYDDVVLARAIELTKDPNFYYGLRCDNGAALLVDNIYLYYELGIVFLTSRPVLAETFTKRWLKKNISACFTLKCGVLNKAEFLSKASWRDMISFIVDDNPDQVESMKEAGFNAICFDQPWNEGVFPRIYINSAEDAMLWKNSETESLPFLEEVEEVEEVEDKHERHI